MNLIIKYCLRAVCLLYTILPACTYKQANSNSLYPSIQKKYEAIRYNNADSIKQLFITVDTLYKGSNDYALLGFNNLLKAVYYNQTSNYKLSQQYSDDAYAVLKKHTSLDSLMGITRLTKAQSLLNQAQYDESTMLTLEAQAIFEKIKNETGLQLCKIATARAYQVKGEINKAKPILLSLLKNIRPNITLRPLHTLANIYGEQGAIDSALLIDNTTIYNLEQAKLYLQLSPFYNNKALCLLEYKMYDSAYIFFRKSLTIDSLNNDTKNMAANYDDIGSMYLSKGEYGNAELFFKKSALLSKVVGNKTNLVTTYKNLSNLYQRNNNYKAALLYTDSAVQLKSSIDNVTVNTKIEELNILYASTKKEKQIQEQKVLIIQKNLWIAIILVVITFALILVVLYIRKQKLKQQYAMQQVIIKQQQEKTTAILAAEETERKRISRDLHDNMGAYTSAIIANVQQLKITDDATPILAKMENNASQILGSLRDTIWVLNNKSITIQELNDTYKNYCFGVLKSFESLRLITHEQVMHNHTLQANTALQLLKIMQEVLQNTIKHASATAFEYHIITQENDITIILTDDGVGYLPEQKALSNGIENIHYRAEVIQATIQTKSELNIGTTYTITLAINNL